MAILGAGASIPLTQSYGAGGSVNSGQSVNSSSSSSWSNTNAAAAREWSAEQASIAFERQRQLQKEAQEFNAQQAKIARDWQESMANTVYTRSVKNMIEAGINPILAANMGLSGASVGSGQTASISAGSAPIAQSFMDSQSASSAQSAGESYNAGKSWNSSESGIVTAISALGDMFSNALGAINSANTINLNMGEFGNAIEQVAKAEGDYSYETTKKAHETANSLQRAGNTVSDFLSNALNNIGADIAGSYSWSRGPR